MERSVGTRFLAPARGEAAGHRCTRNIPEKREGYRGCYREADSPRLSLFEVEPAAPGSMATLTGLGGAASRDGQRLTLASSVQKTMVVDGMMRSTWGVTLSESVDTGR